MKLEDLNLIVASLVGEADDAVLEGFTALQRGDYDRARSCFGPLADRDKVPAERADALPLFGDKVPAERAGALRLFGLGILTYKDGPRGSVPWGSKLLGRSASANLIGATDLWQRCSKATDATDPLFLICEAAQAFGFRVGGYIRDAIESGFAAIQSARVMDEFHAQAIATAQLANEGDGNDSPETGPFRVVTTIGRRSRSPSTRLTLNAKRPKARSLLPFPE